MKTKSMIAKTVLITLNVLFAYCILFEGFMSFAKSDNSGASFALRNLKESGAVDTNGLAAYMREHYALSTYESPMECMARRVDLTGDILKIFILPSLCLLLLNVVLMGACWKRPKPEGDGTKTSP
jgi:hypothetical protein